MKKKIQLIGPLTTYGRRSWKHKLFPVQSLALPAIASLTHGDYEISIHDIGDIARDGLADGLDADIVGVSVLTRYASEANMIADRCRELGVHSVHGGIHASALPHESRADTVFIGEAEETWPEFLRDFENRRPKKLYANVGRRKKEISLPEPRRDLFPKRGVAKVWDYTASVEYSRGCPFRCEYCSTPLFGEGYSTRPVAEVMAELRKIEQKYISFISNNFAGRPEHTRQLLREMRELGKKWIAGITPATAVNDPGLIREMRASGCIGLLYGFESLSEKYLETLGNPQKRLDFYKKCIDITKDAGIAPEASFILGSDYEDASVFPKVLEFVERNKIPMVSAGISTPFPGTRLFERMREEGRLLHQDWGKYDLDTVVFRPHLMKPDELQEGYQNFLKELYSMRGFLTRLNDGLTLARPWTILANVGYKLVI